MLDAAETTSPYEGLVAPALGWLLGWGTGAVKAAVAMKGWEWYVVDTFDAPSVGFIEAWGLWLLVSFVTLRLSSGKDDRRPMKMMVESVISSLALSGLFFVSLFILAGYR